MVVLLIQFLRADDGGLGVVEGFQGIAVLLVESPELLLHSSVVLLLIVEVLGGE
jgi:hypothetical protein